jgi:hypothetical protein
LASVIGTLLLPKFGTPGVLLTPLRVSAMRCCWEPRANTKPPAASWKEGLPARRAEVHGRARSARRLAAGAKSCSRGRAALIARLTADGHEASGTLEDLVALDGIRTEALHRIVVGGGVEEELRARLREAIRQSGSSAHLVEVFGPGRLLEAIQSARRSLAI